MSGLERGHLSEVEVEAQQDPAIRGWQLGSRKRPTLQSGGPGKEHGPRECECIAWYGAVFRRDTVSFHFCRDDFHFCRDDQVQRSDAEYFVVKDKIAISAAEVLVRCQVDFSDIFSRSSILAE